jgi:hypothetical protein
LLAALMSCVYFSRVIILGRAFNKGKQDTIDSGKTRIQPNVVFSTPPVPCPPLPTGGAFISSE